MVKKEMKVLTTIVIPDDDECGSKDNHNGIRKYCVFFSYNDEYCRKFKENLHYKDTSWEMSWWNKDDLYRPTTKWVKSISWVKCNQCKEKFKK